MLVKCPSCNAEHDCGPGTFRCRCGAEIQVDPNGRTTAVDSSVRKKRRIISRIIITILIIVAILPILFLCVLMTPNPLGHKMRMKIFDITTVLGPHHPLPPVANDEISVDNTRIDDIIRENGGDDNDDITPTDLNHVIDEDDNDDIIPNAQE